MSVAPDWALYGLRLSAASSGCAAHSILLNNHRSVSLRDLGAARTTLLFSITVTDCDSGKRLEPMRALELC